MWKSFIGLVLLASVLVRCQPSTEDKARLVIAIDSLKNEIQVSQKNALKLHQVGMLLDSIDASRFALRTRLEEGTTYEEYTARMREINNYVKKAEQRITFLEKTKAGEKRLPSSFIAAVKKLRHELVLKDKELSALQASMAEYRKKNLELEETVTLQELQLADMERRLEVKRREFAGLEKRKNVIQAETRRFEAEAYFLRARAYEETASRTRFAPRKKKKSQRAALELYRLAAAYGKLEAQRKVRELQGKI